MRLGRSPPRTFSPAEDWASSVLKKEKPGFSSFNRHEARITHRRCNKLIAEGWDLTSLGFVCFLIGRFNRQRDSETRRRRCRRASRCDPVVAGRNQKSLRPSGQLTRPVSALCLPRHSVSAGGTAELRSPT